MTSSPTGRTRLALGLFALLAACDHAGAPAPSPSPKFVLASPRPGGAPAKNLAMGTGEARNPEPFTMAQRFLEAVRTGDRPTIERALERGATIDAKDDLQRSAIILATMDQGDLDLVRWLRGKGAAPDDVDLGGRTALSFAAADGNIDLVRWLVGEGAVVDRPDQNRRTALFHAATGDHVEVIAFLLDHGADVNTRDQFGDTPLIVACARSNTAAATLLIARGADPTMKDQEGRTARERSAPGIAPCLALP